MVLTPPNNDHGGDIRRAGADYGIAPDNLLDFSSNINPLGLPKGFYQAVRPALRDIVRYPEISYHSLSKTLPRFLGVESNRIISGCGSTELLYLVPLVLKPKRCLVCSPSYADYERAFQRVGVVTDFFPAEESDDFRWDLTGLAKKIPAYEMIVMGNPNNPTSVYTPQEDILHLAQAFPDTYFLVDEAFIDFLSGPFSLVSDRMPPNLLVLKSLTKFYAIPGLRLGCMVASLELIDRLKAFQEPWTVNCLAAAAGEFLLKEAGHKKKTQAFVHREKGYLFRELAAISGLTPFPPSVNFILVKINRKDLTSTSLKEKLVRKGILIRDCANFRGLSERYFRVSVNTRKENTALLAALTRIIREL